MLYGEKLNMEVVVINDGSTDGTEEIAKEHGAFVINHSLPQGVGASFFEGVREALNRRADYAVNIDADGQMDPKDIERLLLPIWRGGGRYGDCFPVYGGWEIPENVCRETMGKRKGRRNCQFDCWS